MSKQLFSGWEASIGPRAAASGQATAKPWCFYLTLELLPNFKEVALLSFQELTFESKLVMSNSWPIKPNRNKAEWSPRWSLLHSWPSVIPVKGRGEWNGNRCLATGWPNGRSPGFVMKGSSWSLLYDPSPIKSNSIHTAPAPLQLIEAQKKIHFCCLVSDFMALTRSGSSVLLDLITYFCLVCFSFS